MTYPAPFNGSPSNRSATSTPSHASAPSALDSRLALMQLSDSFFPSGSFTLSHGLESLQHNGQVRSPDEFEEFVRMLLLNRMGTSDLVALNHAYRASVVADLPEIHRADAVLCAQTLIQTTRDAQRNSGRALLMVACSTWDAPLLDALASAVNAHHTPGLHPVVFGVVSHAAGLSGSDAQFAFVHSLVTGLTGAAIRLGLLGHLRAQAVLRAIAPTMEAAIALSDGISIDEMWTCTPAIDIAQMQHPHLSRRLFTT